MPVIHVAQFGLSNQSNNIFNLNMFFQEVYNHDLFALYITMFFLSTLWIAGGQLNINVMSPRFTYHHQNRPTNSGNNANISSEENNAIE